MVAEIDYSNIVKSYKLKLMNLITFLFMVVVFHKIIKERL